MATVEQIRNGFADMFKAPMTTNIARVKSVNEDEGTCVLIDEDEQEYLDVRLKPILSENESFIQIPKIGTFVMAIRVEDDDDWMLIASDEVERYQWTVAETKFELSDKVLIEAGNKNLLDLMQRLFTVIERGYQTNMGATIKLILEPEFNTIKNDFKTLLK